MPKISLWNSNKRNDYSFNDRVAKESVFASGEGLLIHKYEGTVEGDETVIEDKLFLENRNRNYSDEVFELRGYHRPTDTDYDLTQFGIFLSSDTVRFTFHLNDMIEKLGRKLMSGDVIEVPSERDINLKGTLLNSYYVVTDGLFAAEGHGATWNPHLWKVRATKMTGSYEYKDVLQTATRGTTIGNEGVSTGLMSPHWLSELDGIEDNPVLCEALTNYCDYLGITEAVVKEAQDNVFYDPKFFLTQHLYIVRNEQGYPVVHTWADGDGIPPDGAPLRGVGTSFPPDMQDGEYFLRVDYEPDRLFQKQGDCYARIEDDLRKIWTSTNRRLDTYINNNNVLTKEDGRTIREKQSLSTIADSKYDLNEAHKEEMLEEEVVRKRIARSLDDDV